MTDAVAANPSRHTQVQGVWKQVFQRLRHVLEQLRFDRPDHELRVAQAVVGLRQGLHPMLVHQQLAGAGQGLDHTDAVGRRALFAQASDQGLRHVAPADEGDGRQSGKDRGHEKS